jgi:FKBP-type peptidyl-prolyl cis-trans isomerase
MDRRNFIALTGALVLAACGPSKKATAAAETDAGKTFLANNAKLPGVTTLPSGLQYKIIRSGPADGLRPQKQDEVKVNYEGKLLNGTVFDSSFERGQAAIMPAEGLIPGWLEALPMMHVGDEWTLWIPANLAYGERESGPIPANSVLVFKLRLIDMLAVD